MTKDVYVSLLRQGSNGNQILEILDNLISGEDGDANVAELNPTLDPIEF